jgi:hypothetical protein
MENPVPHDDFASEDGPAKCPFCLSTENCPHLLLVVDKTFRTAEGGVLMRAFNGRWSDRLSQLDGDANEREPFEELLDEVQSLCDEMLDDHGGGAPGMSSSCVVYFVSSENKARDVVARFGVGTAEC